MGSRVTRVVGFLPANYQFPTPFRSRLRVRHGQTDRQTDGRTDGQTDRQRQSMNYASIVWGHNNGMPIATTYSRKTPAFFLNVESFLLTITWHCIIMSHWRLIYDSWLQSTAASVMHLRPVQNRSRQMRSHPCSLEPSFWSFMQLRGGTTDDATCCWWLSSDEVQGWSAACRYYTSLTTMLSTGSALSIRWWWWW